MSPISDNPDRLLAALDRGDSPPGQLVHRSVDHRAGDRPRLPQGLGLHRSAQRAEESPCWVSHLV